MKKKIHKEELLYEVNDTKKIILGNNLHRRKIDYTDEGIKFNWSVESLIVAEELAMDKGVELPHHSDNIVSFEYSYYCKINGVTYKVTTKKRTLYGDIHYKIEKI